MINDGSVQQRAKTIFSKNLLKWMSVKNKTQSDICMDLGFTASTVSDWVNAKKYPRVDKMQALADYFGIYLSDLRDEHDDNILKSKASVIPVLGYVRAGIPIEAVEEILDYEEISDEMARTGEHFALKIKGDSMEPRMREGDVVIVRKQSVVDNGDIAVVLVNGDDATVKKFFRYDNGISLISFNPNYDPFTYTSEQVNSLPVQVIGKVVELRAKF